MKAPFERDECRYAIWLSCRADSHTFFSDTMADMQKRWGGPVFPPHLTLTSRITGAEDAIITAFQRWGAEKASLQLPSSKLLISGEYYQAVIIPVACPPALEALRKDARTHFNLDPNTEYKPHLSLLYGVLDQTTQDAIYRHYGETNWGTIPITRLTLWRLQGEVAHWQQISEVDLVS